MSKFNISYHCLLRLQLLCCVVESLHSEVPTFSLFIDKLLILVLKNILCKIDCFCLVFKQQPLGVIKYVSPYISLQTPEEDSSDHLQCMV